MNKKLRSMAVVAAVLALGGSVGFGTAYGYGSFAGGGGGSSGDPATFFASTAAPAPVVTSAPAGSTGQVLGVETFRFTRNLTIGSTGTDVTHLQQLLADAGIYSGAITGYYGKLTQASVKVYQKSKGISPTGSVGPITRVALNGGQSASVSNSMSSSQIQDAIKKIQAQIAELLKQVPAH